jgi:C4-type Zn-finger protein
MNLALEKQKIKQQIDSVTDESIILTIKKLLGLTDPQSLSVLTKEQVIARALESEKAIAEKNFISLEELEKEMQNW